MYFSASPGGHRVGFASIGTRQGTLLVCVLPKAWSPRARSIVSAPTLSGSSPRSVVLYEQDVLHVASADLADDITAALASETDSDNFARERLLTPDFPPTRLMASEPTDIADVAATARLLTLMDRVDLLTFDDMRAAEGARALPLLRPLLYRHFMTAVEGALPKARRNYRSRTTVTTVIRGRVDFASVLQHESTMSGLLRCTFDESTENTALLSVIATALHRISAASIGRQFPFPHSPESLRRDAAVLQRALSEVSVLPVATAAGLAATLRLNRLDQHWAPALRMALCILRSNDPHPVGRTGPNDAVEVSVDTARLWERVVEDVLRGSGVGQVIPSRAIPSDTVVDPWHPSDLATHRLRPDLLVTKGNNTVVVDAKYKRPTSDGAHRNSPELLIGIPQVAWSG